MRALLVLLFLSASLLPQEAADAAFRAQQWAKAGELYRAVVDGGKAGGKAWYRLGYCLHAQGKYEAALEAHETAAGHAEVAASASYNAACANAR